LDTNQQEFKELYAAWQPKIHRYLVRLVGESEAEDLTQETFIKVSRGLKGFRGEANLSTWIYRIATNAAVDRSRNASFRRTLVDAAPLEALEPAELEGVTRDGWSGEQPPSPEQLTVRKAMNECIQDYVANLPEDCRAALVLSEMEGFKNREIAAILGVSLATIKIRLHRARAQLRVELERHCDPVWIEENEFLPDLKSALNGASRNS